MKIELSYTRNTRLLLVALFGAIFGCLSYLIYAYDPLKAITSKLVALSPGSLYYNIWVAPPFGIYVKVYVFNVTNAEAFLRGEEKLKFNEVGPYVYLEMLNNSNNHFNENGTLTYTTRRKVEFVPEKSIGDPNVDTIISPNIPLLGITAALHNYSMFVNLAVSSASNYLNSKSFVNLTIEQYLWGYEDRLVGLANTFVPNWINFSKFGILDRVLALDTAENVVTINVNAEQTLSQNVLLTEEERSRLYIIQRWNGSPGLHQWGYRDVEEGVANDTNTRCNTLEGAFEGIIFPPNLKKNTTFRLYRRAFCRPVPFVYTSENYTSEGYHIYNFNIDQNFLERGCDYTDNSCYCLNGNCPRKGLSDLTPCYYDIPVAISLPHFMNGDPSLLEDVGGLQPDPKKHSSTFQLHPEMGIPLKAELRVQLNLMVPHTRYNSKTRPFNGLTLPLSWVELFVDEIPTNIKLYITLLYHIFPVVQEIFIYLFAVLGVAMVAIPAVKVVFLHNKKEYSPIRILPLRTNYFKPEIRISK